MEHINAKAGLVSRLKKNFDEVALWIGLVFIASLIATAFYNIKSSSERSQWVTHTYEVLRESDALISAMKDAETGQRGFLLTGEPLYLEPYENARHAIEESFNKLKTLTADNSQQQERLQDISKRIKLKLAELEETILLRKDAGLEPALEVVKTNKGKIVMDEFRMLIADFQQAENKLLAQRAEESSASTNLSLLIQGIGGTLVVIYLSFALISVRKQKKSRQQLFQDLDNNNKEFLLNNGELHQEEQEVIRSLVTNLQSTKEFIRKIGNKEFDIQIQGLDQEHFHLNKANMAGALLEVRDLLKKNEKEESVRRWTNEGIAKFSDLIRKNSNSLDLLANDSLQNLVKYIQANQGALYIVSENNNDVHLEVAACYAWNKKKFIQNRIEKGEGIAGQAWQEGDTLFLTDVPKDYINIKSGLGSASPTCILVVPLKANEEVLGILEIASFQKLEEFEIKFVEKIAETLASALSTAKINDRTQKLLETSQQQSEELRAAEEEMRQNMEELEATQEEMHRKEIEMRGQLTAIDNTLATVEFDMHGHIRAANDIFQNTMGYQLEEVKGKHHRMFCEKSYTNSAEYEAFWQKLSKGIAQAGEFKRKAKNGKDVWLRASYTPVFDKNGNPYKIIKLAFEVEKKQQVEEKAFLELQEN